jgi:hypothetical protein
MKIGSGLVSANNSDASTKPKITLDQPGILGIKLLNTFLEYREVNIQTDLWVRWK